MFDTRVPYDKSTVIWSPEGELVQLSYARRACEKGQPAIGVILDNETILLAGKGRLDELGNTTKNPVGRRWIVLFSFRITFRL